jgi:hypothetical protein
VGGGRWKGGRDGVSAKGGEQIKKIENNTKTNRKREKCGKKKLINEGGENHIEDGTGSAVRRTNPRPAGGVQGRTHIRSNNQSGLASLQPSAQCLFLFSLWYIGFFESTKP